MQFKSFFIVIFKLYGIPRIGAASGPRRFFEGDAYQLFCPMQIRVNTVYFDITNILVVSPQVRYIEAFDLTNPRFNEQILPVPSDFVKLRFHRKRFNQGV